MIGAAAERRDSFARTLLLIGGVAAATALRVAAGGRTPAASLGAAALFASGLLALAMAAGWPWRRDPHRVRVDAAGAAGAGLLLVAWLSAGPHLTLGAADHVGSLLIWTPLVIIVATAEEVMLRGALFAALLESHGATVAVVVTSIAFGLMHVPLYGWSALPLDTVVGLFLGGLRLVTGGVTAPVIAHAVTDVAAGWLG